MWQSKRAENRPGILRAIDPSLTRGIEERLPARCWSCDEPVNPEVGHFCPIDPRINWHGCKGKKTGDYTESEERLKKWREGIPWKEC